MISFGKIGFIGAILLNTNLLGATEMSKSEFEQLKHDQGMKGFVVKSIEALNELEKRESKVEPFGQEYNQINVQKDNIKKTMWDSCLQSDAPEDFSQVGVVECTPKKFLLSLKIKSGFSSSEKTIELTKD